MAIFIGQLLSDRTEKLSIASTDYMLISDSSGNTYKVNPNTTFLNFIENNINSIANNLSLDGSLTVSGDLTVNGTQFITNTETVEIKDNILLINNGETGSGVTAGSAGIEVDRGTENNYQFIFNEANDSFQVGEVGDLQSVATREAAPINDYFAKWNDTEKRFDTVNLETEIDNIGYLKLTGGILTGDLEGINASFSENLKVSKKLITNETNSGGVLIKSLDILQWDIVQTGGYNNLRIGRYDNSGNYLDYFALSLLRSNGNVGIGISAPTEKLDVDGNINISGVYKVGGTSGVSGSFTTADSKTVTVTGGIITSIV